MRLPPRNGPQGPDPIASLQAGGLGLLAASLLYIVVGYTSCWWPFSQTETCQPPGPSKLIMFLIDASEGITRKEPKPLAGIIHSVMGNTKPGDTIIVSQITDDPKAPTRKIARFKTPMTKSHLDEFCKANYGNLPNCGTPDRDWPARFVTDGSDCGKKSIVKACEAEDDIRKNIEGQIVFPDGKATASSPIVAALESSEEILIHSKADPENRAIHVYSDMVQNNPCWWSMIRNQKNYIDFYNWDDRALLRTKRQAAAKCIGRPIPIKTKKVIVHRVPRNKYLPSQRHVLNLKNFWKNFLRHSEVGWQEVGGKQSGTPGTPK